VRAKTARASRRTKNINKKFLPEKRQSNPRAKAGTEDLQQESGKEREKTGRENKPCGKISEWIGAHSYNRC
jgi:hypothetical protein